MRVSFFHWVIWGVNLSELNACLSGLTTTWAFSCLLFCVCHLNDDHFNLAKYTLFICVRVCMCVFDWCFYAFVSSLMVHVDVALATVCNWWQAVFNLGIYFFTCFSGCELNYNLNDDTWYYVYEYNCYCCWWWCCLCLWCPSDSRIRRWILIVCASTISKVKYVSVFVCICVIINIM